MELSKWTEHASRIKKGSYVLLNGFPCKVSDVVVAVNGKHGHTKAVVIGFDIMTGRKYSFGGAGHILLQQFQPRKQDYLLLDATDTEAEYLDEQNQLKRVSISSESIKLEIERRQKAGQEINVTVMRVLRSPKSIEHPEVVEFIEAIKACKVV